MPSTPGAAEVLSASVDRLWTDWQTVRPQRGITRGRRSVPTPGGAGAVVWRAEETRLVAFVALPSYVEREWLAPEQSWLDRQNVRVALREPSARVAPDETRRVVGDTGLPWTVTVTNTNIDAELARLGGRRRLWLAGLAALAVLVLAGTAVAVRAVSSELAVARLQSDFVSAVSHEFRTPLTSLRQIAEVLQEARVGNEERRQHYYRALVRQTNRLQHLVEALLDFGRMEAGAAPYRLEPLRADQLVARVVRDFSDEAAARGQPVNIHVTSVPVVAQVDADAMANAIWNLLDNAVKYSPGAPEAWVDVGCQAGGVAVSVLDRGMGVPAHEHRDIFRKFVRGARATSERISGTGIGLAVVDHVVRAHRGHLHLVSAPDAGSTFTIWLPDASPATEVEGEWRAS